MEPAVQQAAPAPAQSPPKIGVFKRGWRLTKSAWHVWRLDKELTSLPLISFLISILAVIPIGLIFLATSDLTATEAALNAGGELQLESSLAGWQQGILIFLMVFATTVIANFFSGAVIYGAVQRFRGGNPTIRTSLSGAARKFRPLALFSLMMVSVGFILQFLEERLPFAGRIAVYLFDAAWNIANIFAIPVIVLSEENVGPLQATKKSVQIIKKVWGEGIIVSLGIGAIALVSYLLYIVTVLTMSGFAFNIGGSVPALTVGVIGFIGLIGIILVFTTLNSIAKAALYHFAVTGEAPGPFDKDLLRSSMTHKKASKIFS